MKIYFPVQKYISQNKNMFQYKYIFSSTKLFSQYKGMFFSTKIYLPVQKYISQYKNIFQSFQYKTRPVPVSHRHSWCQYEGLLGGNWFDRAALSSGFFCHKCRSKLEKSFCYCPKCGAPVPRVGPGSANKETKTDWSEPKGQPKSCTEAEIFQNAQSSLSTTALSHCDSGSPIILCIGNWL